MGLHDIGVLMESQAHADGHGCERFSARLREKLLRFQSE